MFQLKALSHTEYEKLLQDLEITRRSTAKENINESSVPSPVKTKSSLIQEKPTKKMATFLLDNDDLPEIKVDVMNQHTYPEGFTGVDLPHVSIGKGFGRAFEIRFYVNDPNDIITFGTKKYSGVLAHDGMSICASVPTVPSYAYKHSKKMLTVEAQTAKEAGIACPQSIEKAQAHAVKLESNPHLQTRRFKILLNKKCRILDENFGVLGGRSATEGHELIPHDCIFEIPFGTLMWPVVYFYWRVQVDNTYETLSASDTTIKSDLLAKKLSRLTLVEDPTISALNKRKNAGMRGQVKMETDEDEGKNDSTSH